MPKPKLLKPKPKPQNEDKEQSARFFEMAKRLQVDETEQKFSAAMTAIAKRKN